MTGVRKGKGVRNRFPRPLGQYRAEHRHAGDGCQRPLRSRFRQRLMPGVRQSLPLTASAAKTYNLR